MQKKCYTGAPLLGTPTHGTHYIVSCDAEVCGAERDSSRMIRALSVLFRPAVFR